VKTGMTLVVYMGVARASEIRQSLLAAGLGAYTPVLIVENASLPAERQLSTSLATLTQDLSKHEIASPSIMIIGEVARKRLEDEGPAIPCTSCSVYSPLTA
jgi:uroporphyrin-III C-methyltransferase